MVGSKRREELLHPHVGNLAEIGIERVHPRRRALGRHVGVVQQRLQLHGHVTLEGGQLTNQAEGAASGEDPLLQRKLRLHERARQWARNTTTVLVLAARPREEGWAVEPPAHIGICHAERCEDLMLHLLLAGHRQVHVNTPERHPVNQPRPVVPPVPNERVRVRAHVHKVRVLGGAAHVQPPARRRHRRPTASRYADPRATSAWPADGDVGPLAQVVAHARGKGGQVAAVDDDLMPRQVAHVVDGEARRLAADP